MNQLGTVYATKRRRRNGKSLKPSPKESSGKSNPSKRHRERLNAELDTLASLLPYEASILSKLDRLSILRLSVSYLRTKSYFQVSCHKGIKGEQQQPQHSQHVGGGGHFLMHDNQFRSRDVTIYDSPSLDGESFLQALNGFLLILTSDGEVFFATHTIESYLGFHQSDVVHQSVYELVHSEDREELQRQLTWSSQLPTDSGLTLLDALRPDNSMILERSFTVRFRCLLDNTSGFLRLDIRGRVKVLHGQNRKMEEPPLALFAICTPFGPPSLLELPHKESMFKSKHRLDLALVSMDQRGKALLGHSDAELSALGGYDLVHFDDLAYVASAHQELLKTGASGLIAYRLQTKDGQFQWLQTSSRLVYKNSKPDFIISTHRPLMEEEGRDLMGKRTMDFKVSYLDAGLTSNYFTDQETGSAISATVATTTTTTSTTTGVSVTTGQTVLPSQTGGTNAHPPQKIGRKYKNQLRDFLTNCRTKRKSGSSGAAATSVTGVSNGLTTPPEPSPVHYLSGSSNSVELASATGWTTAGVGGGSAAASSAAASAAVAAAATAYSPSVYQGASAAAAAAAAATVPYHADATNSFYHSAMHHHHHHHQLAAHHHHAAHHQPNATLQNLQNLHQSFYGTPGALDHNRFGIGVVPTAEHNLFHHGHAAYARGLGVGAAGYYAAEYSPYVHAAAATTNGFLTAGYDSTIGGMSQLYGGSSNSSPAGGGGGGGAGSPAAGDSKYATTSTSSVSASSSGGGTAGGVSSLGRLTTSLHHHHHHGGGGGGGLGGLLSSGETEPSSESSGTSTSSIAGGDSPYNNGHHNNNHHHQQQQQQQRNLSSRSSSRKPVDQQQQQMMQQQQQLQQQLNKTEKYVVGGGDGRDSSNGGASSSSGGSSSGGGGGGYPGGTNSNDTRQTVLMWGSSGLTSVTGNGNNSSGSNDEHNGGSAGGVVVSMTTADLITSTTAAAVAAAYAADCGETGIVKTKYATHHGYNGHHHQQQQQQQQQHHHVQQQQQQQHDGTVSKPVAVSSVNGVNNNLDSSSSNNSSLNSACKWGRVGPHYLYGAAASAADVAGSTEVSWPPHHHHPTAPHHHHHPHHQYYPYPYHHAHHHHHQSPHQLNF